MREAEAPQAQIKEPMHIVFTSPVKSGFSFQIRKTGTGTGLLGSVLSIEPNQTGHNQLRAVRSDSETGCDRFFKNLLKSVKTSQNRS